MTRSFLEIEKEVMSLSNSDKALMARHILETLGKDTDEDIEELWIEEAERRYDEYKKGNIGAVTAEAAFREARQKLK